MEINNKTDSFIFWAICFILFLPIIIIPPNFQPSDWTRVILFKITLTVLISFLIYSFFYKKDFSFSLPKRGYLFYLPVLTLFGFLAVSIFSTILSEDIRFSVFGSPPRAGGVLNLSFFIIFAVLISILIKGGLWEKLIKINFIAGVLASFLAIVQYFGLFKNVFLGFETGATPSFLGNSTFLAIYMIFLVFSSFTLFILEENKNKKAFYLGLFLLFLFTVFVTSSRAAYVGVLIGFAFYLLSYPRKLSESQDKLIKWINPKRLRLFKIISAVFMLLILLSVVYVNMAPKLPGFIENNAKLSFFIHNRLSFENVILDLTGTRLSAWKITFEAIKEKPLFGWGPENFHIGFEKYFDPTLPPSLARLWWDRPHNVFLEILVNSGIFALIFYVAFWVILLWQLQILKNKRDNIFDGRHAKNSHIAHALQAMFIGYLTVLFFNFDSFETYIIAFFFIGYALHLIFKSLTNEAEKIQISPPAKPAPLQKYAIFAFLGVIILFLWFGNVKPLYINEKIVLMENLSESKQCKKALSMANKQDWTKTGIIKAYSALRHADFIKKCAFAEPENEVLYAQKSLLLLKTASKIQSKYSRTWLFMGAFGNVLAAREESNKDAKNKILEESRVYLKKSIELSPKRQEMFIELAKNYMLAEDYKAMESSAYDCIKIDPSVGECYWYLGIAQIFMGDQKEGKKNIGLSKEKHYNDPPWLQLGIAYIKQKNYKDAALAYENLAAIYPENASYHATLALLYKEIKNYERAGMEAMRVFELQPENPETVEFVKLLIGLNQNIVYLHSSLASIYKQLGREEEMKRELLVLVSAFQQFILKNPKNPDNHFPLAIIYKELKEYDKAYQEALLTIKLDPGYTAKVESFIQLLPPKFLEAYTKYLKSK